MEEAAVTQLWMLGVIGVMVAFCVLTAVGALFFKKNQEEEMEMDGLEACPQAVETAQR